MDDLIQAELSREVRRVLKARQSQWLERGRAEGRLSAYAEIATRTWSGPVIKARPGMVLMETASGVHRWMNPDTGEHHENHPETGEHANDAAERKRTAKGDGSEVSGRLTGDAYLAKLLGEIPEEHCQKATGFVGKVSKRVNDFLADNATAVKVAMIPVQILDAVSTTPEDMQKYPWLMGKYGANTQNVSDALGDSVGIPGHLAAKVIAGAVAMGLDKLKKMLGGKQPDAVRKAFASAGLDAAAEVIAGLLDAATEGLGMEPADPAEIRAGLEGLENDQGDEADPHEAIAAAMIQVAHDAKESGEDPMPAIEALRALLDDPAALAAALQGGASEGTIAKAVGLMVVRKAWDASAHPRGKNGHFIAKGDIEAAKSDPAKAAELRAKVKPEDAAKLDKQLGEAPKGPGAKQQRAVAKERGAELLKKLGKASDLRGKFTADDLHALADHLSDPAVTVAHLREVRQAMRGNAINAGYGGAKAKAGMVAALVEHAKGAAFEARLKEQGIKGEAADEMRRAAGRMPKEEPAGVTGVTPEPEPELSKPVEEPVVDNPVDNPEVSEPTPVVTGDPHKDPLSITPENVKGVWEKFRDEIVNHNPKLSPNEAGSIAASRILNQVSKAAEDYNSALDAKVAAGGNVTDEEDEKYIRSQSARKDLYGPLAAISGYRPYQALDEHPLAQRPFDAAPLENNAAKQSGVYEENKQKAAEVQSSAEARRLKLDPVKGRIDWDGTLVPDEKGDKTLYRDQSGELHRSASAFKEKQREAAKQAAAKEQPVQEQKAPGSGQVGSTRDDEIAARLERVKANMKTVSDHFHQNLKDALKKEGHGDLAKKLKYRQGGSVLPDDAPESAVNIRNELIGKYKVDPAAHPDELAKHLAGISTPTPPRTPRNTGRADDAAPTPEEIDAASKPYVPAGKPTEAPPADDATDMGKLLDQPAGVPPGSRTGDAVARAEGAQAKRTGTPEVKPATDIDGGGTPANNPGMKTRTPSAKAPKAAPTPKGYGERGGDHHLTGDTPADRWKSLGKMVGDSPEAEAARGRLANSPPKGLNLNEFGNDIERAAAKINPSSGSADVEPLYELVGKKYGLSKGDFVRGVMALNKDNEKVRPMTEYGLDSLADPKNDAMGQVRTLSGEKVPRDPDLQIPDQHGPSHTLKVLGKSYDDLGRLGSEAETAFSPDQTTPPTPTPEPSAPAKPAKEPKAAKPAPVPKADAAKANVPAGHKPVAEIPGGAVTAKDPKTGELSTHFPPGMREEAVKKLGKQLADAVDEEISFGDGYANVSTIVAQMERNTGAPRAEILAAIDEMQKHRAFGLTTMVEGKDLQAIDKGQKNGLAMDGSKGLGDAFLWVNGNPAARLQRSEAKTPDEMMANYAKYKEKFAPKPDNSAQSPQNTSTAVDNGKGVSNNSPVEPPKSGGGNAGGGKMTPQEMVVDTYRTSKQHRDAEHTANQAENALRNAAKQKGIDLDFRKLDNPEIAKEAGEFKEAKQRASEALTLHNNAVKAARDSATPEQKKKWAEESLAFEKRWAREHDGESNPSDRTPYHKGE